MEIKKDGYLPWRKNLEVKPEEVADAEHIILVPAKISLDTLPVSRLRGDKIVSISSDSSRLIILDSKSGTNYLYDLNNLGTVFNISFNFQNTRANDTVQKAFFHPFDPNKIIIQGKYGLYILDILRLTLETINSEPINFWAIGGNNIYFASNTIGTEATSTALEINSYNLIIKSAAVVADLPDANLKTNALSLIKISPDQSRIGLLNKSGNLYIYTLSIDELKKLASNISQFDFSPDNQKIAFSEGNKLNIYFFADSDTDSRSQAGDTTSFNLKNSVAEIDWYRDSVHLLLKTATGLEFSEIDNREPVNNYSLFSATSFLYNPGSSLFYLIKDNSLLRFNLEQ